MNESLPKAARLANGKVELVPSKTIILNPERKGQCSYIYFVWPDLKDKKHTTNLSDVIADPDRVLYGWFSNDEYFLQNVYERSSEAMICITAALAKTKPPQGERITFSFMKSAFMAAGKELVAKFEIDPE